MSLMQLCSQQTARSEYWSSSSAEGYSVYSVPSSFVNHEGAGRSRKYLEGKKQSVTTLNIVSLLRDH